MGSSGGGHGSGEVTYPEWFELDAEAFLDNIQSWVISGVGGNPPLEDDNPYDDVYAYNPDERIGMMMAAGSSFRNYVQGHDTYGIVAAAAALADEMSLTVRSTISPEDVENAVSEFWLREQLGFDRALSIVKSGYDSMNAVNSSAFLIAQALLAEDLNRKVAEFDANLTVEAKRLNITYLSEVFRGFIQTQLSTDELNKALVAADIDSVAKILIAEREEVEANIHLNSKQRLWPMQVHAMWANAFASLGGGTGMASQDWHNSTEKSGMFGWGTFLF